MNKAISFIKTFNPYRNKYTLQGKGELFNEPLWYTKNQYLSNTLIQKAIFEQLVIGFFITQVPNCLGIDIDDHRGIAWKGLDVSPALLKKYNQVVNSLHSWPSLLLQSPRGLHAYWIMTDRIPADLLIQLTREKLKGIPVEIKPTPTTALRIPVEKRFLNPKTFHLMNLPFEEIVENCIVYHPTIFFNTDYLPGFIFESVKEKRVKLKVLKHIPRIEKIEDELLPFQNGNTNDSFLKLCMTYRIAGYDIEETLKRFQLCLLKSPRYTGDLHNEQRLRKRIEWEYNNNTENKIIIPEKEIQTSLFNEIIADNIANMQPFAKQRKKPIKRFIEKILYWCDWHDDIFKNPGLTAYFDYLYPYYRKNRKNGLYPLPRNYLRKVNKRYYDLLPWLEEIHFLIPTSFKYSHRLHICKYYEVNRDIFI